MQLLIVPQNSHFYWPLASARAIIPGLVKEEQYLAPISKAFVQYSEASFEFVIGAAENVDFDSKTVQVSVESGTRALGYDHLVLATGSRPANDGVPWKARGTYEELVLTLRKTTDEIKAAKHIVVAGGGPTGVETAGELAYEFKDKTIVLVNAGPQLLNGDVLADSAEKELTKLGVKIRKNSKVVSTSTLPRGQTQVTLENAEIIATDMYLPTMGVVPNSEYLPSRVLDARKFVQIDEYYKVSDAENVWAVGDLVWKPRGGFMITGKQVSIKATHISPNPEEI